MNQKSRRKRQGRKPTKTLVDSPSGAPSTSTHMKSGCLRRQRSYLVVVVAEGAGETRKLKAGARRPETVGKPSGDAGDPPDDRTNRKSRAAKGREAIVAHQLVALGV